ncbi:hypothetical protein CAOG_04946 [Capsaspora owczarzaki ATCC 30864]|uniref:Uncharacterized protein n=1 Tax=Capsaspora owczarzaki (strain ATCC 30864) TaxID=595528 RepID=A0A0D2X3G7_CAPO3|nr:hypothetical protein CAOG_04946 [Capsaspora owczarzaki ATCC 30864]KJE94279.1 hypothetical protein CAOG_004946 [Capsaspora owczarzaki ATCC 30864]|eukprot:XP_004347697.2 hypothetical protein CAOG_04946 [Capsaspora owczarzaki ATCC 30864]
MAASNPAPATLSEQLRALAACLGVSVDLAPISESADRPNQRARLKQLLDVDFADAETVKNQIDAARTQVRDALPLEASGVVLLEREQAKKTALNLLSAVTRNHNATDRFNIGVIATLPGAGKTAFCDLIHSDLAKQVHPDGRFISLNVTFGSRSSFTRRECNKHPEHAVSWRILEEYLNVPATQRPSFRDSLTGSFRVTDVVDYIRKDFVSRHSLPTGTLVPVIITLDEASKLLRMPVNARFDNEFDKLPRERQDCRFLKLAIAPLRELSTPAGKLIMFLSGTRPFLLTNAARFDRSDTANGSTYPYSLIDMPLLSGAASAQKATSLNHDGSTWHRDRHITQLLQRAVGNPRQIGEVFSNHVKPHQHVLMDFSTLTRVVEAVVFQSTDAHLTLNPQVLESVQLAPDSDKHPYLQLAIRLLEELKVVGKMLLPQTINNDLATLPWHELEQLVPCLLNLRMLVTLCFACKDGTPNDADLRLPLSKLLEGAILSNDLSSSEVVLEAFSQKNDKLKSGFSLDKPNAHATDIVANFALTSASAVQPEIVLCKAQLKLRTGLESLSVNAAKGLISDQRNGSASLIAGLVSTQRMTQALSGSSLEAKSWLVSRSELHRFFCGLTPIVDALVSYNPNLSDGPAVTVQFRSEKLTQAEADYVAHRFVAERSKRKAYFSNHKEVRAFLEQIDPELAARLSDEELTWNSDEQPPKTGSDFAQSN